MMSMCLHICPACDLFLVLSPEKSLRRKVTVSSQFEEEQLFLFVRLPLTVMFTPVPRQAYIGSNILVNGTSLKVVSVYFSITLTQDRNILAHPECIWCFSSKMPKVNIQYEIAKQDTRYWNFECGWMHRYRVWNVFGRTQCAYERQKAPDKPRKHYKDNIKNILKPLKIYLQIWEKLALRRFE